ncbi:unnamed protein product [Pseudo-nitzschia multistriata]|uniref:Uncharacterized protein n=1 Tax=Pseudo-nitzschia multistriata TaxID=183589 RepID=A0A448ZFP3_9STRA|nr:unnamed protein product [Pseudo-nitzschia multistriata]
MYQNYNDVYTPSVLAPTLDWNFNRGLSTSSKALGNSRFPTMLSVFNEPSKKIFATAQLEINATTVSDIENGDPIQYLQYDGSNLANQDTSSETTAITNLMEYTQDADTQIYYPIDDGNSYIYSLVGLQNGQVNLCQVFMGSEVEWTTSCWFTIEDLGDAIADMLYIPQVNIVIMLTVKNVMVVYNVSWSNSVPTLTYFGQKNDLSECYDGSSADSEDKKESGCHELPSPRSLSGLFVDENNIFVYLCAPQGLLAFQLYTWGTNPLVNVQGSDNDWIGTDFCVQSVPTPYGLYLHNQMEVLFLPFVQYDPAKDSSIPPYAMFGNANPEIYLVYRRLTPTDDVGSSHSNDSGEDTFDLITSIAFSPNTNNVVSGRSHVTGNMQSFYEGGALVIATIRYDDTVVGTTKCLSGKFNKDDATPSYSSTCPGSIVLNDICAQGKNNEFINDLIDGPAYGLQVDNNMNILTQNGQGGISFFSVGYLPGMAQDGVFLANLVNPCSGSKIKTILAAVLAAAALIIGCVAFLPALAGTAAATALAATSLAAGTAGAVVPFV